MVVITETSVFLGHSGMNMLARPLPITLEAKVWLFLRSFCICVVGSWTNEGFQHSR
ncbi:hypothetical protein BAME_33000 [Bacillus sp. M 2-6]|nr:hypothetical protein BAME_33000 [Bacillus sp. M 2-6]